MNYDMPPSDHDGLEVDTTPSAEFIHAISEFFDTDPSDLLVELGYYKRQASGHTEPSIAEAVQ
jgi:hypothetical protein